jgi:hypothetical protein
MRYGRASVLLFATGLSIAPGAASASGPAPAPAAPPVGRPLGRPLGQPAARPLARPLAAAAAAPNPVAAQVHETPKAVAPHVDAPAPLEHLERAAASHGRDAELRAAELSQVRPGLEAARTKLAAARTSFDQAKASLEKAETGGPGFFADVFTLGGASRRHYARTGKLRASVERAKEELAKAEQTFRSVKGRFDKAEASLNESQGAHAAATAELQRAKQAQSKELMSLAKADAAAKANQYLAHLVKNGGSTESFRRAMTRMRAASFVVDKPRDGGALTEDAVALNPEKGVYAISDGVTNAVDSGPLARLLVRHFAANPPKSTDEMTTTWLRGVQADWSKETSSLQGRNLWFNQGALGNATFVGAEVLEGPAGPQVRVSAIGDSMIFVVRGGKLVKKFPLETSAQFSNMVETIPSRGKAEFPVHQVTWDVSPDDEVFMTTDALGKWVFTQLEHGQDPFAGLRAVKSADGWSKFVSAAREPRDGIPMDVDDTALVRFVIPKS